MVVDNYTIRGDATLFEGSVVKAYKSPVEMRTGKGVAIVLGTNSQGQMYSDHLVLQHGQSELSAPGSFHLRVGQPFAQVYRQTM
jgi:hypothetical protein